ncbi:MAG: MATE family efflux transporter [Saccharofermentans sp.]|nr:MATE family efflux transporter [Saccharofermentans sp.]
MFDTTNIKKTYLKMALPVVIGMTVTLIYNLADTWFIARTNNTALIAGVSLCAPLFTALMAFGNILGQGGSSLVSRLLGGNDTKSVKRVSSFCFYSALVVGIVIGVLLMVLRRVLLPTLGADETNIQYARQYYTVMALGSPIVVLNFIHSNLVRCEGMATQSMLGSLLGTVVNIILDPIFIFTLGMGARGAAVATIIGYVIADAFFVILVARKSKNLSLDVKACHVNGEELGQILGVGITAAITNLMSSVCMVIMNRFLTPYGNEALAAMGMVLKVNMIAQLILVGFAFGGVPVYGFLYGSKNHAKLKELSKFCIMFLCGIALAFSVVLIGLARPIMSGFTSDPVVFEYCVKMLRFMTLGTIFVAVVLYTSVYFQATGRVVQAFIMSVSRQGVVFMVVIFIMSRVAQLNGVLLSQAVADLVSAAIGLLLYLGTIKKN